MLNEVHLELVSHCNLTCDYCTWREGNVAKQKMPKELAIRLVRECADLKIGTVAFHGVGEPTLHPDLLEICDEAERLGLHFGFSTNAVALESDLAAELRTLTRLAISLSIHWNMPGGKLARAIDNAVAYASTPSRNERVYCLLVCAMENARHYWRHLGTFMPWVDAYENVWLFLKGALTWPDSGPVAGFTRTDLDRHPRVIVERNPTPLSIGRTCDMPKRFLKITADGTIAPCCVDNSTRFGLGKIGNRTLAQVWASEEMARARSLWQMQSEAIPCGKCLKRTDC